MTNHQQPTSVHHAINTHTRNKIKNINQDILIYQIIRDSINLMVKDLIRNTIKNIKNKGIKSINDVYKEKEPLVIFSDKFKKIEKEIKFFLRKKMYDNKKVVVKNKNGMKIIKKLFFVIKRNPKKYLNINKLDKNLNRGIADFISGMTDRYAINLYKNIK